MSINPVLLNATIQRVQDFSTIKQNTDQKGVVDQSMIQHNLQKADAQKANQVIKQENAEMMNKKFDASEQGANQYTGDGGRRRKKGEQKDGVVVKKEGSGGFDIKI